MPAHPDQSPLRVLFQRAQEEGQVVGRQVCPELRDVLLDVLGQRMVVGPSEKGGASGRTRTLLR